MDNPRDTLVTLTRIIQSLYYAPAGRYIKRKCRQRAQYYSSCGNIGYTTLEKTEEAIKNGKSRVTGNIGYTMLEKTEGAIMNGQSRNTGNIGYTMLGKNKGAIKNGQSRVTGNINILGTQR